MFKSFSYLMSDDPVRLAIALLPAILLLIFINRRDKVEKEPFGLLASLFFLGVGSAAIAIVLNTISESIINGYYWDEEVAYNFITYLLVGLAEEFAKYLLLFIRTWRSKSFDYRYDAIVYAVFVSAGFAAIENVQYVAAYGWGTALIRFVTAVPGHIAFAVLMGFFYGKSRENSLKKKKALSAVFGVAAYLVPALVHATYDFFATTLSDVFFYMMIAALFVVCFIIVRRVSKNDYHLYVGRSRLVGIWGGEIDIAPWLSQTVFSDGRRYSFPQTMLFAGMELNQNGTMNIAGFNNSVERIYAAYQASFPNVNDKELLRKMIGGYMFSYYYLINGDEITLYDNMKSTVGTINMEMPDDNTINITDYLNLQTQFPRQIKRLMPVANPDGTIDYQIMQ